MLVIINDILDLSKIEAGKLELETIGFYLNDVIKNSIDSVSYLAAEKDLFISEELESKLNSLVLLGDPTRLNQIFTNLLNNAIKFTTNGEVKLKAQICSHSSSTIEIQFSVTDTGIGIPENKLQTIFESFNQADSSTTRRFGGTGLGLSICKKLVELHKGQIKVESQVNKGTTFIFNISFRLGDVNDLPLQQQESEYEVLKGVNVLLVEDHKINQVYAISVLEDRAINVDLAENGKDAILLLSKKKI